MPSYPLTLKDVSITLKGTDTDGSPVVIEIPNADMSGPGHRFEVESVEPSGTYTDRMIPPAARYFLHVDAELRPSDEDPHGPVFAVKVRRGKGAETAQRLQAQEESWDEVVESATGLPSESRGKHWWQF